MCADEKQTQSRIKFTKIDSLKMIHSMISSRVGNRLDEIKQYYEGLESKFQADKKRLAEQQEKEIRRPGYKFSMENEINDRYGEEHLIIEDLFLKNFRYSVVVIIYSFLENTINDLCRYFCHSKKLLLSLDEVKGEGLERAKLYLEKVCLLPFPERSHEWQEIQKFNQIRNCIVHAEGDVDAVKAPDKLKKIIKNTKGVELDEIIQKNLRIQKEYIITMLAIAGKFMGEVHEIAFNMILEAAKTEETTK